MSQARSFALAALAALVSALAACASPRTEVIVVTDTDIVGPGGLDRMTVDVTGPDGRTQQSVARIGVGEPPLPRTVGLVWTGGELGPYTVRVSGHVGASTVITRTARFSFQQGRTLVLRIDLLAQCVGEACGPDQTCGEAGCRPVDIGIGELPPWTGTISGLDASIAGDASVDSGIDGGPIDGGDLDGGPIDSGIDGGPIDGGPGDGGPIDGGPIDGGPVDGGPVDGGGATAPTIVSSDYAVVAHGGRVRLTGSGFSTVTGVTIGGVAQTFAVVDDATIDVSAVPDTTPLDVQPVALAGPVPQSGTFDVTVIHLVVTEVDVETDAGTDAHQFVEIETGVPGVDLTGYVVVAFGGTADDSFASWPLTMADAAGRVLLGNAAVTPMPSIAFASETLGNAGTVEAIAIYQAASFAGGTAVTATDLIDAVAYARSGTGDMGLTSVLLVTGGRMVINENGRGMERTDAITRCAAARRDARAWRPLAASPGLANTCP